jgi:hypothetical protein
MSSPTFSWAAAACSNWGCSSPGCAGRSCSLRWTKAGCATRPGRHRARLGGGVVGPAKSEVLHLDVDPDLAQVLLDEYRCVGVVAVVALHPGENAEPSGRSRLPSPLTSLIPISSRKAPALAIRGSTAPARRTVRRCPDRAGSRLTRSLRSSE